MSAKEQFVSPDDNPHAFYLSLTAVAGKKIKDIQGYITHEFGDPTFQLCNIIFEDGSEMGCEGEHDLPYLTAYDLTHPQPEFLKNIEAIDNEESEEYENAEDND